MADAFNKFTGQGQGTLVGNWQEERELRELTGHGRNYPINHVPRVQGDPVYMRNRDGTETRIHGTEHPIDTLNTFNFEYGKSTNPADNLAKLGRREQLLKAQIYEEIKREEEAKLEEEKRLKEARMFDTTTKTAHGWVKGEGNIGRRIMKDQNLKDVQMSDAEFAVEHGFRRIQPITDVEELKKEVERKEIPITFYADSLHRQTVPISAPNGVNPFAKTVGFSQR